MRNVWIAVALCLVCGAAGEAASQEERVYLAPDDHTDYMWSGDEETYRKAILQMTDYYLNLADRTVSAPADFQSRWNMDGALWMWMWERNRSPEQVQRLVARLKDGHFSMPLNFAVSTYGGMPTEAALRSMYYSGQVERRYGLRFPTALAMENQTLPLGLESLFSGSGARYSWRGVCACATKLEPAIWRDRPHEIYWWKGTDDSRILLKWYSIHEERKTLSDFYPGGYAEAGNPGMEDRITFLDDSTKFRQRYPYKVFGFFGEGGDNLFTINNNFPKAAQALTKPGRRVIVSNEEDFFRDFEKSYGEVLPTETTALGNDWDTYSASMQEVTSSVRRATEELRSAEAMESLVGLKRSTFTKQFDVARDLAWVSYGLYWEHDWTADSKSLPRKARADWQRKIAGQITSYVADLQEKSMTALGNLIVRRGTEPRFFVFNALSWMRTDAADLPYRGPDNVHVVDLSTGKTVPSQFTEVGVYGGGTERRLRILAEGIPSIGYKVFAVLPGTARVAGKGPIAQGATLDNGIYRLRLNGRGAIESLVGPDGRELASSTGGLNDLGAGNGVVTVKDAGPVSATLEAQTDGPVPHITRVTLYRGLERVAIRNELTANFRAVQTWGFHLNLKRPDVWHEEVGAILHARVAPEGNYAGQFSKLDWLTLNHFVAMNGEDGAGVTLSSADDGFFRLGASNITNGISFLDTASPVISVLAGGQVDGSQLGIQAQDGDRYFLQRFGLRGHQHFSAVRSMRFSLEDQNPLVAGAVGGGQGYPETSYSLLTVSDPQVLVWALKPAEDGTGEIVARVWNLAGKPSEFSLRMHGGLAAVQPVTHLETDLPVGTGATKLVGSALQATAARWQLRSFRLVPAQTHTRINR